MVQILRRTSTTITDGNTGDSGQGTQPFVPELAWISIRPFSLPAVAFLESGQKGVEVNKVGLFLDSIRTLIEKG